jgi:hypothetical protein
MTLKKKRRKILKESNETGKLLRRGAELINHCLIL